MEEQDEEDNQCCYHHARCNLRQGFGILFCHTANLPIKTGI
ncbi:Uncharacterised protein [Segatella copri]|nr:Uncharacterised protein [Segatella copri]